MAKAFRPVLRDQAFLLPSDMRDWLPEDHLVWFLLDVVEVLDVSDFERSRTARGCRHSRIRPADAAGAVGLRLLPWVRSSRRIERLCPTDVTFRVLCAQDVPDHATIARFRADGQEAFVGLASSG